jgi:hypothetical protein
VTCALDRWVPYTLAASACVGLVAATAVRAPAVAVLTLAAAVSLAAVAWPHRRVRLFASALLLAGWWWGSTRIETLDRSVLRSRVGQTELARAVVTGPARRGEFSVRAPAEVRRFGRGRVRERVLLELPAGRAPPQGAILQLVATVELPRAEDSGFD